MADQATLVIRLNAFTKRLQDGYINWPDGRKPEILTPGQALAFWNACPMVAVEVLEV